MLTFERGSASEPTGHALAYMRNATAPDEIFATYLIVPPISIDLAKYMPPMFASKISLADMESLSAVPLPPVPERVQGIDYLQSLAERRGDDIVFLGTLDASDVQGLLVQVAEAAQEYLSVYTAYIEAAVEQESAQPALGSSVDDVLFGLMNDRDKLGEMAKLLGKLRYAADGGDEGQVKETTAEMEALGRHLPEKYRAREIVAAGEMTGEKGRRLSELHISRCYKICDEDYLAVEELEGRIREAEALP